MSKEIKMVSVERPAVNKYLVAARFRENSTSGQRLDLLKKELSRSGFCFDTARITDVSEFRDLKKGPQRYHYIITVARSRAMRS